MLFKDLMRGLPIHKVIGEMAVKTQVVDLTNLQTGINGVGDF